MSHSSSEIEFNEDCISAESASILLRQSNTNVWNPMIHPQMGDQHGLESGVGWGGGGGVDDRGIKIRKKKRITECGTEAGRSK